MSAYRAAIDQTTLTIERRARNYRNLVIGVVVVSILSISSALVIRSLAPLLGSLLIIPLCGMFFFTDSKVLEAWRFELLKEWVSRSIDIAGFSAAIRANPILPKGTTEAMLATLPSVGNLAEEQKMSSATREAVAVKLLAMHQSVSDSLALRAGATALVACALILSGTLRRWEPLLVLASLVLMPIASGLMRRRRLADFTAPPPAR